MRTAMFHTSGMVAAVLPFLLYSCGQSGAQDTAASGTGTNATPAAAFAVQTPPVNKYGTDHSHVPLLELGCAEKDFTDHIQRGKVNNHRPFNVPPGGIHVKSQALLTALDTLPTCEPTGALERCVVVHYGLDGDGAFSVRLQVLCLTYDAVTLEYTYPSSNDCLLIESTGDLTPQPDGLLAWRAGGGGWSNYTKNVVIMPKSDGVWRALDKNTEPHSTVFAEDGLRALIAQNSLALGALSIVPIAEPEIRTLVGDTTYTEEGYHQSVAWLPVEVTLDNEIYPGEPYKHKALDLGSPCPPNFPNGGFAFWTRGTAPRAECQ